VFYLGGFRKLTSREAAIAGGGCFPWKWRTIDTGGGVLGGEKWLCFCCIIPLNFPLIF